MSKSLKEAIENQKASIAYTIKNAKRLRDLCKQHKVDKYFTALVAAEPRANLYVGTYSVQIEIPVLSMKHMLEAIEAAQIVLGFEFDETEDYPASGQRRFGSKAEPWLLIIATIPTEETDGQTCKRVLKGMETVERPVYVLECSE